ncbi:hypothetical protein H310_14939 [Aphanomyces invadans]|uniref:Uncharacterized protein n=1 Tax=Aphanomyces invadans TaxID=157072 RepID=A0A024TA45_9STRA|nr:hypothetical protein H310_14939 [Aphanomyces invadans]ETV90227.1 hypothetical protein H310_14939 [Aphanomyces invadans]|eukprot:XP_008881138.1 hypothetical protein H310_14939 [Aphanomyces invadans]
MKFPVVVLVAFLVSLATANKFTYYVFARTWLPGQCRNRNTHGCAPAVLANHKTKLTIHGLWPNGIESCPTQHRSTLTADDITRAGGAATISAAMPGASKADMAFWTHEWTKHGTCSNMPAAKYFKQMLHLRNHLKTPAILNSSAGPVTVTPAFGGNAVLICSSQGGVQYLTEVRTCHLKNAVNTVSPCPGPAPGNACSLANVVIS